MTSLISVSLHSHASLTCFLTSNSSTYPETSQVTVTPYHFLASGGKNFFFFFIKNLDFIWDTSPSPTVFSKTWNTKIWFLGKVKHFLTKDTWLIALREVMCHFVESPLPCRQFPAVFLSRPREPAVSPCAEPDMIRFRSRQRAGAACSTCSASRMRQAGRLNQAMLEDHLGIKKKDCLWTHSIFTA